MFFFRPDLRGSSVITRLFCFSGRSLRSGELNLRKAEIFFTGIINSKNRGCYGYKLLLFIFTSLKAKHSGGAKSIKRGFWFLLDRKFPIRRGRPVICLVVGKWKTMVLLKSFKCFLRSALAIWLKGTGFWLFWVLMASFLERCVTRWF